MCLGFGDLLAFRAGFVDHDFDDFDALAGASEVTSPVISADFWSSPLIPDVVPPALTSTASAAANEALSL